MSRRFRSGRRVHSRLSGADRVEVRQVTARVQGSLTTFDILFADRMDRLRGQKGQIRSFG